MSSSSRPSGRHSDVAASRSVPDGYQGGTNKLGPDRRDQGRTVRSAASAVSAFDKRPGASSGPSSAATTEPQIGGETCDDCGQLVGPHTGSWWHADDDLWMEVVEPPATYEAASGRTVGVGVLCPPCFTARCDAKGIRIFWHARVEYRDGEDVIKGQRRAGLRV